MLQPSKDPRFEGRVILVSWALAWLVFYAIERTTPPVKNTAAGWLELAGLYALAMLAVGWLNQRWRTK